VTDSNGGPSGYGEHPPAPAAGRSLHGEDSAPGEISELVILCVEAVRRAVGFELDFAPETLPVVDHYVSIARQNVQDRPELLPLLGQSVGAYFGEVLRGEVRGFWRLPSANIHDWAVCARSVFLWMNPIGAAFDALTGGAEHDGPRSQLHVAPEYREAVDARLSALPEVSDAEYVSLATRLEVIQIAAEALRSEMRGGGYEDVEFTLDDYEAELRPLARL
jgi:hypothetical protein